MQKILKILLFSILLYSIACPAMERDERQQDKIQELSQAREQQEQEQKELLERMIKCFGSIVQSSNSLSMGAMTLLKQLEDAQKHNEEEPNWEDELVSFPENSPRAAPENSGSKS